MSYKLENFIILKEQLIFLQTHLEKKERKQKDRKLSFINKWKMLKHSEFYNK